MELEDPRRRLLINALSVGAGSLLLNSGSAWADAVYADPPVQLPPGQSIYRIRGELFANGQLADLDTDIGPNDEIHTGKNSEAIFVVGGHSMMLRQNSKLALKGAETEVGAFIVSALRLITGKLMAVSRDQRYSLRTPTATIGIRGTGIYAEAEPDLTYFCTCYGKSNIFARNDPLSQDTVVSTHHNRPLFIAGKGKAGKHIRHAGYRDHTDEELLLIETIVGRTTPFKVPYDGPNPYLDK